MNSAKLLENTVFHAALSVADAAERELFLDQACAGNPNLRRAVEEMLAAQNDAENFFSKGRSALQLPTDEFQNFGASAVEKDLVDEQIGTRIGRYKLLQRIGEGGCGVVYMAEQEEPVHRRVAVKVIKLGMDTKSVIARFEAERQALAMMDHLNIARVLDAGATETGRPYFVMELVRGVKVTEYCNENNLDTRERLDLFVKICHAIQHAHQKGIIHRDIKPSNILVTLHDGVPVPKVIDFGIAKAIEGKLTEQTLFTAYEQIIGTPAYMSPEQAEMSGLDVDTRSDIYSLGVLLYELLTGRTPFDGKTLMSLGVDEMRRTLREDEPQRPSSIVTTLQGTELRAIAAQRHAAPPKLISLLKGDLDWIVMKTLEKDRTRRYETANGIAMDIQRYLNSEPVVARPPSRMYRFQKLVRRNKIIFAAGTAVALALLIGLGASTWLFFREKEARQEQARLRAQAEQSEKRETKLREQAEARGKIDQAAILVSQQKFDEANQLLNELKTMPSSPSFDGISALRQVSDWLAVQGRWTDAADRFSALMQIDKLDDWNTITLDYQSYGIVVAESGDVMRFQRFYQEVIANFSDTTNGSAASRILKVSLLMPIDKKFLDSLAPLARTSESFFSTLGNRNGLTIWQSIPISLWKYRCGDYTGAIEACKFSLNDKNQSTVQGATDQMILAMSYFRLGQSDKAQAELAPGRELIENKFKSELGHGDARQGFWWDWVYARILLREASGLIEGTTLGWPIPTATSRRQNS